VHVNIVTHNGRCDSRVILVLYPEAIELIEHCRCRDGLLVDPAFFPFGGPDFVEAPPSIEDLQLVAVLDSSGAIRDSGYAVPQIRLLRRHIDILRGWLRSQLRATGQRRGKTDTVYRSAKCADDAFAVLFWRRDDP
jgi:hypothetical protein